MKKIIALALIVLLAFAGTSMAAGGYDSENVSIIGPRMGGAGITPVTQVIKVRYGYTGGVNRTGGELSSGDVVVWDTTSADGYTISACVADGTAEFAGVLVEDVNTADSVNVKGNGRNTAYIAVHGFALANVDTSASTAGEGLALNGATLTKSLAGNTTSIDIGVLLSDTGVDGLMPVWLR